MPGKRDWEIRPAVVVIVVHLGHVLDELGFWLAVTTKPVLVNQAVAVIVLSVNAVLIEATVVVLVNRVNRAVVDVVVLTCVAGSWNQWSSGAQRSAPFKLIIS